MTKAMKRGAGTAQSIVSVIQTGNAAHAVFLCKSTSNRAIVMSV